MKRIALRAACVAVFCITACRDTKINNDAIVINNLVRVSASAVDLTEGGNAITYTLTLLRVPHAPVTFNLAVTGEALVNGAAATAITFNPGGAGLQQTVSVSVTDDTIVQNPRTASISHTVTSSDALFSDIPAFSIPVTIADDDYRVSYSFTGASLAEATGQAPSLTPSGAPASAIGADGDAIGAYQFSGTQNLSLPDSTGFPTANEARSFCAYVHPDSYPASGFRSALSYGENSATSDPQGIGINAAGFAQFNYGLAAAVTGTVQVTLRTWSHVCATFDGSTAALYVNGSLEAQVAAGPLATVTGAGFPAYVGRWVASGGDFIGRIDEVRIYKRTLSTLEIRRLARQVPSGLVLHYDMIDAPSGTVSDLGTAASHGTAVGVVHTVDRRMKNQSAYAFDGAASVTAGVLPVTTDITFSAWVKPRAYPASGVTHKLMGNSNGTNGATLSLNNNAGTQRLYYETRNAGAVNDATFNYTLPFNTYTHLAVTQTGATKILYINGAVAAWTTNAGSGAGNFASGAFALGGSANAAFDLDDVRVYDRALTAAEVRILSGYHVRQVTAIANQRLFVMADTATCAGAACGDGGAVDTLADYSGSGHDLTATGIARPTFMSAGIGGRPAMGFLSTAPQFIRRTTNSGFNTTYTLFWVVTQNAGSLGGWIYSSGNSCLTDNAWSIDGSGTACNLGFAGGIALAASGPYLISLKQSTTTSRTTYTAGVTPGAATVSNFNRALNSGIYIGRRGSGAEYFTGTVSELMYFNTPLSDPDRELVECYLSARYNIAVGHSCP
jgi:Concanavalin A-like lectin/glucanases superfamily